MAGYQIALSTWSLHGSLGPIRLTQRDEHGRKVPWVWDQTQTLDLLDFPAEARRRLGVTRFEICQMHLPSRDEDYLSKLSEALTSAGGTIVNIPIDIGNISAADDTFREDDLRETESWIDVAARLGSPMVRVNTNGPPPMAHEPIGPLETTIASLRRLVDYGAARGVAVTIENHGGLTEDPETIVRLVEAVGSNRLKVCVDVGNFEPALSGQRPGGDMTGADLRPLYDAIARIAPYAGMLHAKTARFDAAGDNVGWDVVHALRLVRDAGYRGDVSIEYGGGVDEWENSARTKRLIERAFAD